MCPDGLERMRRPAAAAGWNNTNTVFADYSGAGPTTCGGCRVQGFLTGSTKRGRREPAVADREQGGRAKAEGSLTRRRSNGAIQVAPEAESRIPCPLPRRRHPHARKRGGFIVKRCACTEHNIFL